MTRSFVVFSPTLFVYPYLIVLLFFVNCKTIVIKVNVKKIIDNETRTKEKVYRTDDKRERNEYCEKIQENAKG